MSDQPVLVFGDDASDAADVAWLWINSHRWTGWDLDVLTARRPEQFTVRPAEASQPHEWQPEHPRVPSAETGIQVSVLCPGTILTPMIEKGASPERWVGTYSTEKLETFFKSASGMAPDVFARKALDRIAKNKSIIVLPTGYKMLWWINRVSPTLAMGLSQKIYNAILKRISD